MSTGLINRPMSLLLPCSLGSSLDSGRAGWCLGCEGRGLLLPGAFSKITLPGGGGFGGMHLLLSLFLCVHICTICTAAPLSEPQNGGGLTIESEERTTDEEDLESTFVPTDEDTKHIIHYLHRYGYLNTKHPEEWELKESISSLQNVLGLRETGSLDEATNRASRVPRCAAMDLPREGVRKRRFVLAGASRWNKRHFNGDSELHLKWYISNYPKRNIHKQVVRSTVQKAFQLWASQQNIRSLPQMVLKFEEAQSEADADINILWAEDDHKDGFKFDGTGVTENVLAHTFFPDYQPYPLNGDIHFDDAETWDVNPQNTRNTFFPYVLAHEIGHALGLQHSKREKTLMHPLYKNIPLDELKLDVDDKCGINWNYVGPSNFCLFVWLMSEIVPISNASQNMISPDSLRHDKQNRLRSLKREVFTVESTRAALKEARIPRCLISNNVQAITEEKLMKNLHFAPDDARKYSQIACNFLAGLHVYRGSGAASPDDSIETEFSSVHEFADNARGVRRMIRRAERKQHHGAHTVLDPDHFTAHFYDRFFEQYFA